MTRVRRVTVTLRLSGDDLDPGAVARALNCSPDTAVRKGEALSRRSRAGRAVLARTGIWSKRRDAGDEPGAADDAILRLLATVTDDLSVWRRLAASFRVDLFCGLFLGTANEGLDLAAPTLRALADRGIALGFDIHAGADDASDRSRDDDWSSGAVEVRGAVRP